MAINSEDGSLLPSAEESWRFCTYEDSATGETFDAATTSIYVVGDLVFAGCLSNSQDIAVFRARTPALLHVYPNVGTYPWRPISDGRYVWMTFRDTDNMAVFDALTGELLRVLALIDGPTTPILYDDWVWVYNANADVLQLVAGELE